MRRSHRRARELRASLFAETLEPRALLCTVLDPGIGPASHGTLPEGWTAGKKKVLYISARRTHYPLKPADRRDERPA